MTSTFQVYLPCATLERPLTIEAVRSTKDVVGSDQVGKTMQDFEARVQRAAHQLEYTDVGDGWDELVTSGVGTSDALLIVEAAKILYEDKLIASIDKIEE